MDAMLTISCTHEVSPPGRGGVTGERGHTHIYEKEGDACQEILKEQSGCSLIFLGA